jgi:hypothetical protein
MLIKIKKNIITVEIYQQNHPEVDWNVCSQNQKTMEFISKHISEYIIAYPCMRENFSNQYQGIISKSLGNNLWGM